MRKQFSASTLCISDLTIRNNQQHYRGTGQFFIYNQLVSQAFVSNTHFSNNEQFSFFKASQGSQLRFSNVSCLSSSILEFENNVDLQEQEARNKMTCLFSQNLYNQTLQNMRVQNMSVKNCDIIYIDNSALPKSYLKISDSSFTDNYLLTQTTFELAAIIRIHSNQYLETQVINCTVSNNELHADITNILLKSAQFLVLDNYMGKILISQSQFLNGLSNSFNNFLVLYTLEIEISGCQFQNSSYLSGVPAQQATELEARQFINEGGFISAMCKSLRIANSSFDQTIAYQGGFMYLQSFASSLTLSIESSNFSAAIVRKQGAIFTIIQYYNTLTLQILDSNFSDIVCLDEQPGSMVHFDFRVKGLDKSVVMSQVRFTNLFSNYSPVGIDLVALSSPNTNFSILNSSFSYSSDSSVAHLLSTKYSVSFLNLGYCRLNLSDLLIFKPTGMSYDSVLLTLSHANISIDGFSLVDFGPAAGKLVDIADSEVAVNRMSVSGLVSPPFESGLLRNL